MLPIVLTGAKFVASKKFVVPAQYDGEEDRVFRVYITKGLDGRLSPGPYSLHRGSETIGRVVVDYNNDKRLKRAYIHSLYIDEDYRGLGVGSWFMKVICNQARRNGAYMAELTCADGRVGFYNRLGFSSVPGHERSMFMFLRELSPVDEWLIKFFSVTMYVDYAISDGRLGDVAARIGTIAIAFVVTVGIYAVKPSFSWLWIVLPLLTTGLGTFISAKVVSPIRHEMLVLIKREGRHPDIVIERAAGLPFPLQRLDNPPLDMLSKTLSVLVIAVSLIVLAAILAAVRLYL